MLEVCLEFLCGNVDNHDDDGDHDDDDGDDDVNDDGDDTKYAKLPTTWWTTTTTTTTTTWWRGREVGRPHVTVRGWTCRDICFCTFVHCDFFCKSKKIKRDGTSPLRSVVAGSGGRQSAGCLTLNVDTVLLLLIYISMMIIVLISTYIYVDDVLRTFRLG